MTVIRKESGSAVLGLDDATGAQLIASGMTLRSWRGAVAAIIEETP